MIDFKELTYEKFKTQLIKYIFEHPFTNFEGISKNIKNIPDIVACNSAQLPKFFEFINEFISEFCCDLDSTKKKSIITALDGLAVLIRAGVKSMIESETCDDNTVFPSQIILTLLKIKGKTIILPCSNQDIQLIARYTKISEEEYIDNYDILSPYFKILNKKNNLKTDTVKLLHEVSGTKTSVTISKSARIEKNKGTFSLYGKAYTLKDIESSPTSFSWSDLIKEHEISDSFKKMTENISPRDALEIIRAYQYHREKEYIYLFPQLKNSLISELNRSQINNCELVPPLGEIIDNDIINATSYSYNRLIVLLSMLFECETYDDEYIEKILLLLIRCIDHQNISNRSDSKKFLLSLYTNKDQEVFSKILPLLRNIINDYFEEDISFSSSYTSERVLWIINRLKLALEK